MLKPQQLETDFDPIAFESKNENKSLSEILSNLDKTQKYFIMRELKVIYFRVLKIVIFLEYQRTC